MRLGYAVHGAIWIAVYLLFILAPLFALLAGTWPPARDFWTEFAVALGYSGLAMMGLQIGLTARFRYVTKPWGEDVIYHFHRQISLIAVGLIVTHAVVLTAGRPQMLAPLNMLQAPWSARFRNRVDRCADRAGGGGAMAGEAEDRVRGMASFSYHSRGCRHCGRDRAHGGIGRLPGRSVEARAVDRVDDFLDRAAALRPHRQAAVHAPPAIPGRGSAPGSAVTPRRW